MTNSVLKNTGLSPFTQSVVKFVNVLCYVLIFPKRQPHLLYLLDLSVSQLLTISHKYFIALKIIKKIGRYSLAYRNVLINCDYKLKHNRMLWNIFKNHTLLKNRNT